MGIARSLGAIKADKDRSTLPRGVAALTNPITGIAGCCVRAASGHAAAPPKNVMDSRRFMPASKAQNETS
jgi:hypothetical protein